MALIFNPQMLVLGRESRGLSQKELAKALGISAAQLCQLEQNNRSLTPAVFDKLEQVLNYPKSFFTNDAVAYLTSTIHFNQGLKLPRSISAGIEANMQIFRLHLELLLANVTLRKPEIPQLGINTPGSGTEAAQHIREHWKIPKGPVKNMIELLESKRIVAGELDFGTSHIHSRLVITSNGYPVIAYNKNLRGDIQRYALATELGKLVLHANGSNEQNITEEANLFAAELLTPGAEIIPDFGNTITLSLLGELKKKWKVSMAMLLQRAFELEVISLNQRTYLASRFKQMNLSKQEPPELDIATENGRLLRDMIIRFQQIQDINKKGLAAKFNLTEGELINKYPLN